MYRPGGHRERPETAPGQLRHEAGRLSLAGVDDAEVAYFGVMGPPGTLESLAPTETTADPSITGEGEDAAPEPAPEAPRPSVPLRTPEEQLAAFGLTQESAAAALAERRKKFRQ